MLLYLGHGQRNYRSRPVAIAHRGLWEFQAVLAGRCGPTFPGGAPAEAARRRLWVFGPRCPHGWTSPDARCDVAVAHFHDVPAPLAAAVSAEGFTGVPLSAAAASRVSALIAGLEPDHRRPTMLSALRSDHAALELSLLVLAARPAPPLPDSREHARRKVAQALAWYAEHLIDRPTVEQLARAVFVSPSHLRRLFAHAGDGPPLAAMHRLQLARARELLRQHDLPIAAVAQASGFSGPSVFSRTFHAATGVSPRAWRRRHLSAG